ncbi:unnamed protein product [Kuraishia capsulata CBS 1993]|uniref:RNA helicase n=1 Tax=Kuraishia capsulata CBS 1993 TaxID=1382522 RepID=W6MFL2_9ASCO|nr:uncharacterized protein KUCA_T00000358001 [Kuraishia capsulata CBS 1993]CDK24396.1 unnamed protein product [Kuraishia capsulata CBS 1993]
MGKYRKRFNEKARMGMLAKQADLKRARQKQFNRHLDDGTANPAPVVEAVSTEQDVNSEFIKPMSEEEKKVRKHRMEEELLSQQETKVSKNKKKRLDKYIEHQLKREEKQILFKKLEETRIDSSVLKSAKLLGTGNTLTKREQFQEAMTLESQGRGTEETKEFLYEEREVKAWDQSDDEHVDSEEEKDTFKDTLALASSFVDYRPTNVGGMGSGFAFQNIQKVEKKKVISNKFTWRQMVEEEGSVKRKEKIEEEQDFLTSDSDEEDEGDEEEVASESEEEEEEQETGEDDEDEDVEDEEDDGDDDNDNDDYNDDKPRLSKPEYSQTASAFKNWAELQVEQIKGYQKADLLPTTNLKHYEPLERPEDNEDRLQDDFIPINEDLERKVDFVMINRDPQIQQSRMMLPVFAEEHRIMEAIHHNDCIVVSGETGSGKTTQIPQFLYESGYANKGLIGITQPRRVAAMAMAERVGKEMGDHGDRVGYQIRFDASIKANTAMKFMTDGVLLREMMNDFMVSKYSAIIIDEAHERNTNTDILIGMLSRVLKLRREYHEKDPSKYHPLKLIIMSATLRVTDFTENEKLLKNPPPVIKIETRQFPVSVHFNRRTAPNYTEEAFKKTCKIHQRLPPGGILIFLTGKDEINDVVKRLRKEFPTKKAQEDSVEFRVNSKNADTEIEDIDFSIGAEAEINEEEDDYLEEDEEEEEGFEETLEEGQTGQEPLWVLPLYSLLSTKDQMKVFQPPPGNSRLCVVSTNVAETSITIPGIRYVVDCGRAKERKYNEETGVQSFEVGWISKANSDQRSGRAGRIAAGHCYRLYSSAIYESDFAQFSKPEILRMPIESVVLNMKSMGISNVVNFPFPTPPERSTLQKSEKLLQYLGALDKESEITDLGKKMSFFPLSPRFAKMLLMSNQMGCLPYMIAIVSGLSVGDPFLTENELGLNQRSNDDEDEEERLSIKEQESLRTLRSKFFKSQQMFTKLDKYSDCFKLLSAVCAIEHVDDRSEFYSSHFLRAKIMEEISKLRKQLLYITSTIVSKDSVAAKEHEVRIQPPTKVQVSALKQMVASGFVDQIALRSDLIPQCEYKLTNKTPVIGVPYCSIVLGVDQLVYIHPSSMLRELGDKPPQYLVFQLIQQGQTGKLRIKPLCDISGLQLYNLAKKSGLVSLSKPIKPPTVTSSTSREAYCIPRFGSNKVEVDLPVVKLQQTKSNGLWS